jgi:hypothetical protein
MNNSEFGKEWIFQSTWMKKILLCTKTCLIWIWLSWFFLFVVKNHSCYVEYSTKQINIDNNNFLIFIFAFSLADTRQLFFINFPIFQFSSNASRNILQVSTSLPIQWKWNDFASINIKWKRRKTKTDKL